MAMRSDEHHYRRRWEALEATKPRPQYARDVVTVQYDEFRREVLANDPAFARSLVESLYAGDTYIVKGAFQPDFLHRLIRDTYESSKASDSSFHKMLDGCPDFHRVIDREVTKRYKVCTIRHSHYFFPWNGDPLGMFESINERWRVFKFLGGFEPDAYERHIPSDGVVDRIQVAKYPIGGGYLEPHIDTTHNQRVIIGAMMSKRGVDYTSGGFYVRTPGDVDLDLEDRLEVGDIVSCYGSVIHGVELVDGHRPLDWSTIEGRWFLGLYSNDSDYVENRRTSTSLKDYEVSVTSSAAVHRQ